jgi:alpha-beta hydrolase superfamily lysophospholipase
MLPYRLIADDGAALAAREWLPRAAPKAVIVALHGIDDYSNAFAMPAAIWAESGIATYAYDQRGHGANPNRGRWPGASALCRDLGAAIDLARARWPGLPIYALGESMGGAVVLDAMGGDCGAARPRPDGIILVAPAVWARSAMPWPDRAALWAAVRLFPSVSFTGRQIHILASNNIPMLIALGRDPLFIKATRTDTIYGLVDLMDAAYAARIDPTMPTLLLYGKHDELVPKPPMRDVARRLLSSPGSGARLAYYPHGWHMLLRDLEYRLVAADVAQWIADRRAPLPSGADRAAGDFLKPPK